MDNSLFEFLMKILFQFTDNPTPKCTAAETVNAIIFPRTCGRFHASRDNRKLCKNRNRQRPGI